MKTETAWGVLDRALESIRGCWLFDGLDTRQMLEIAALVEEQSLGAEELLLREGDEVLHFFVVIEGPRGGPA